MCIRDSSPTSSTDVRTRQAHARHWRSNVRLTLSLLSIWAVVGLGCGVLFADYLNAYRFLGFPLGFWFAQQGAIVTFVLLILVYALSMRRFDHRLQTELREAAASNAADRNQADRDQGEPS